MDQDDVKEDVTFVGITLLMIVVFVGVVCVRSCAI